MGERGENALRTAYLPHQHRKGKVRTMNKWHSHSGLAGLPLSVAIAESHRQELLAIAARDRLARQVREPRLLRRRLGALLILAGQHLAGTPASSVSTTVVR